MKIYIFILTCFITIVGNSLSLLAQKRKIDIDNFDRKIEVIGLPNSNKLQDFDSYSILFDSKQETLNMFDISPKQIEDFFHLEGYEYLKNGNGDFLFIIQIGEPTIIKDEIVETMVDVVNPDGSKTKTPKYSNAIEMATPTFIQLVNNETKEILYASIFSTKTNPIIFNSTLSTKEVAEKTKGYKIAGIQMNVRENFINKLNSEIRRIKSEYAFEVYRNKQEFKDVNVKKSPELTDLHNEITIVTNALQNASYREPLLKVQLALDSILTLWSNAANKLSSSDNYEQKLKFVYLYNLAVSQLWLEQFDDALQTCDKITLNDFKKYEAIEIKGNVNAVKEYLLKKGFKSRHVYRRGFYSDYKYVYTKQPIEKKHLNLFSRTENDLKELETNLMQFGVITKQIVEKVTLGDTVSGSNGFYSMIKFELDGVPYEFKKMGLKIGSGETREKCYAISCAARSRLVSKIGSINEFNVRLFTKESTLQSLSLTNIKTLLTKYKSQQIMDISTGDFFDNIPYYVDDQKQKQKTVTWGQYDKELSGNVEMSFSSGNSDDDFSFQTMVGDQFQLELISASPIVVIGNNGYSQGFMTKFKIPILKLTRVWYGHYTPHFSNKFIELKNVEFYILLK